MSSINTMEVGTDTPKELPDTFKKGFVRVPISVLRNTKIPIHLKPLYMDLLSYAWQDAMCFPGQTRLAKDLGISRRAIIKQLKQLVELELIYKIRRGRTKTNYYIFKEICYTPVRESDNTPDSLPNVNSSSHKLYIDKIDKQNSISAFPDEVGQSMSTTNPILLKKAQPAIQMYLSKYKQVLGKNHPRLKRIQLKKVATEILAINNDAEFDMKPEDWEIIINRWFEGVMETDYNINHFASRKIMTNIYYDKVYRRD